LRRRDTAEIWNLPLSVEDFWSLFITISLVLQVILTIKLSCSCNQALIYQTTIFTSIFATVYNLSRCFSSWKFGAFNRSDFKPAFISVVSVSPLAHAVAHLRRQNISLDDPKEKTTTSYFQKDKTASLRSLPLSGFSAATTSSIDGSPV
jgi:hypothetical protein